MAIYWLFRWFDEFGVRNVEEAQAVLSTSRGANAFREFADGVEKPSAVPRDEGVVLVAGRGLDLSGNLACMSAECRRKQVDGLLRKTMCYFDKVVVADPLIHNVTRHWAATATAEGKQRMLDHIDTMLLVRSSGAEPLLMFREKPRACVQHWKRHAQEVGLTDVVEVAERLALFLRDDASIAFRKLERTLEYSLTHPYFEHTQWGDIAQRDLGEAAGDSRLAAARLVARRYLAHLTADVAAASVAGAPLGAGVYVHGRLLARAIDQDDEAQVAFQMNLPVLENITTEALMRVRQEEKDAFLRFRAALRKAMQERKASGKQVTARMGAEISGDLIEPELASIRNRLMAARVSLTKKAQVNISLGALVTTCGLLAGAPVGTSVLAGIGALAATTASAAAKHLDGDADVKESDMYFLWKAVEHSKH